MPFGLACDVAAGVALVEVETALLGLARDVEQQALGLLERRLPFGLACAGSGVGRWAACGLRTTLPASIRGLWRRRTDLYLQDLLWHALPARGETRQPFWGRVSR